MNVERAIRVIAGTFVLTSVALGYYLSPYWFIFTAFVGLNLLQSGFTQWCPLERVLENAGLPRAGEGQHAARRVAPKKAPEPPRGKGKGKRKR